MLVPRLRPLLKIQPNSGNDPSSPLREIWEPCLLREGFLQALRDIATQDNCLLIFDEVITGFRTGSGSAQGRYGIQPDLTCLGKIVGGGLPAAAYRRTG